MLLANPAFIPFAFKILHASYAPEDAYLARDLGSARLPIVQKTVRYNYPKKGIVALKHAL